MKNVILFRFYKEFEVCVERIKLLKHFNPTLEIHGLYGGSPENFKEARETVGSLLDSLHITTNPDVKWKWLHPDIALKEWYRSFGNTLTFDALFDYEWDILALVPLEEFYPSIDQQEVALTAKNILEDVEDRWYWITEPKEKERFEKFCAYMEAEYGLKKPTYSSLGPGPYLSRSFIEDFAKEADNDTVISEISYPAYAEALGYAIKDTGVRPPSGWFGTKGTEKVFNCEGEEIEYKVIKEEYNKPDGIRVFHPVYRKVTVEDIKELKQ